MKVLLCHNHYLQPGGEDQVFADEAQLLESRGCEVLRYVCRSSDERDLGRLQTVQRTLWNQQTFDELRDVFRAERPDVMHCTNIFPFISPAAYDAARVEGVRVVQSLHNFRTVCVNGLLMRDGKPCEKCLGKRVPWQGIVHKCYRDNRSASAVMAASIATQRIKRECRDPVDLYVALSEFSRHKFIAGGFAPERVVVKPNFVAPDPGVGDGFGDHAIFVGRLSEEKGIDLLLEAWRQLSEPIPLLIIGDGPLSGAVEEAASVDSRIKCLGRQPIENIYRLVGDASFLVLPSRCYENCPKTILEAYSKGTPAIVSRHGALQEYVEEGQTGRHFTPGDSYDLARKVRELFRDVTTLTEMRLNAREEFESKYTAEANYHMLMSIYEQAMGISNTSTSAFVTTALPILDASTSVEEPVVGSQAPCS